MAFEYEATGSFDASEVYFDGRDQNWPRVLFHVFVQNCNWRVRITEVQGQAGAYWEMSFDGRYLYSFGTSPDFKRHKWTGGIGPSAVPFFGPIPYMPIIWLALCDSCYLDTVREKLVPPYVVRERVPLSVSVHRRTDLAKLPEMIVFMDDGFDRTTGIPTRRRAPFDVGFTNAIFSASSFADLGGLQVPRQFNLRVFAPALSAKSREDLRTIHFYSGNVSNITAGCSVTRFVPEIPGSTGLVSDNRFETTGANLHAPFLYESTAWLSEEEVRQRPHFTNYLSQLLARKSDVPTSIVKRGNPPTSYKGTAKSKVRLVIIILFAVISLIPLLFLLRRKRNSQSNVQN